MEACLLRSALITTCSPAHMLALIIKGRTRCLRGSRPAAGARFSQTHCAPSLTVWECLLCSRSNVILRRHQLQRRCGGAFRVLKVDNGAGNKLALTNALTAGFGDTTAAQFAQIRTSALSSSVVLAVAALPAPDTAPQLALPAHAELLRCWKAPLTPLGQWIASSTARASACARGSSYDHLPSYLRLSARRHAWDRYEL